MATRVLRRLVAYVTLCAARLTYLDLLSRIALLSLMVVLVLGTTFSLSSVRGTTSALERATMANSLDATFRTARYAVASEESLERKYRLEPGREVLAAHRASANTLVAAMQAGLTLGGPLDRSAVEDILRTHKVYLDATHEMFAAVDRRDTRLALALDRTAVDPAFNHMQRAVDQLATAHRIMATTALSQLDSAQRRIIAPTIFFSLVRLANIGIVLILMLNYQRRLKISHQAQIDKLEEVALTDNLTGIGNHRAYQDDLHREVSRARRHGEPLTLALVDIDDFKVFNDRNGHAHGDRVLTTLAALLRSLRLEDMAYRVGGDVFAVILPSTPLDKAQEAMRRLRSDVSTNLFGCSVSIGFATLTGSECGVETLQAQADAALYAGKRAGRNGMTAFDAAADDMWPLSPQKIHNLHRMIAAGSMQIAFQPIWDLEACRAIAYEALARPSASYGFDGPQEAFDLAERIGRAHELDAVSRAATLRAAKDLPADALLFINVSPQSLNHGRLDPAQFAEAVRAVGLDPTRVVIEVTERSITYVDAVIDCARALQRHGFRLALDDTGAGNSGLEILSRLTFEFVKVDRQVMVKAMEDRNARGVLAGIIAIAEATGSYVIAEGIENAEMLDFACRTGARRAGIKGVQGYLLRRPNQAFPRPDESDDIESLLKSFRVEAAVSA